LRTLDADVEKYLKMFTLLSHDQIGETVVQHKLAPEKRLAQRLLADELTILVHGCKSFRPTAAALLKPSKADALAHAHAATKALFHTDLSAIQAEGLVAALGRDPRLVVLPKQDRLIGANVIKLAAEHKLVESGCEFQSYRLSF
jgi:tyrosyl-tRNA synthetase